ncbi:MULTISPECIES: superoxide dismutase family protein [Sphingomonas]|jgi:Cu-Zn family superoxide dismutase|uniref:superoxide dismutase family protein n=1 Tax=Sphingomonas TaxID=13687 RepID=UPI001AE43489
MRTFVIAATALAAIGLTGCDKQDAVAVGQPVAQGAHATAQIRTPDGADVGRATATEVAGGLRLTLDVHDLTPGTHGAHVHTVGRCDAPDFASAGGHWNPAGTKHGSMNPQGPHEGDLPNLIVGTGGRGTIGILLPGATMAGLLDTDGSAIVVHAKPDDLMTDPSGNSGARIACGVFTAG